MPVNDTEQDDSEAVGSTTNPHWPTASGVNITAADAASDADPLRT
jgi:hypothetical protein